MKKAMVILFIAILSTGIIYAQHNKYCDMRVYQPAFKNYVAEVNYGDSLQTKPKTIPDEYGNKRKFATEAQAVNYLASQGWELVTAYKYKGEAHFFFKKQ